MSSRISSSTSGPRRWTGPSWTLEDHCHSHDYFSQNQVYSGVASQALQQILLFSTDANPRKQNKEPELTAAAGGAASTSTTTSPPRPSVPPSPHVYRTLGTTKVPTPHSSPPEPETPLTSLAKATPKGLLRKGLDLVVHIFKTSVVFLVKLPGHVVFYATHPDELKQKWDELRQMARDEIHHYWVGFKLMWADLQTARGLVSRMLQGSTLTRRERKQLLRTTSDLFRLIPFSMFIIIPFMEFALPFALRLFPNLLPSTFQDSLKAEEAMKREVQSRIAMTHFFQETLEELAKEQKRKALNRRKELEEAGVDLGEEGREVIQKQEDSAASMVEFLEKARKGEMIPPDVIIRYANFFKDDLTLDNMPRMQLINMCKYMSIPPYGSDAFLRFQLRHRIRVLKEDDQRILWEGIDTLTKMELREACQERGMRSTGLSKDAYKAALQQWLDLSVNKNVPISLLIMSRIFFLKENMFETKTEDASKNLAGLADAISGLDKEVVNEVILEAVNSGEKLSDRDLTKLRLEVVAHQNELIRQEQAEREAAAKKKEEHDKTAAAASPVAEEPVDASSAKEESFKKDKILTAQAEAEEILQSKKEETESIDEERNLSADEMEAISHLVSEDPVSKERAELERIKAAMRSKSDKDEAAEGKEKEKPIADISEPAGSAESAKAEQMTSDVADQMVSASIKEASMQAAAQADASTQISMSGEVFTDGGEKKGEEKVAKDEEIEEEEDPVVARLKKRIESMVDKIEVQLSELQVKIGDKFHLLDKDMDGILSREEMADVLQQVFKRKITLEEAMEIAAEIDGNHDGVFTVEELIKWIEKNKLVKFVEEGRDVDMERMMASQSTSDHQKEEDKEAAKALKGEAASGKGTA